MTGSTEAPPQSMIYARIAGFTFLFYIVAGITSMNLPDQSPIIDVLSLLMSLSAVILGVIFYTLTHDQEPVLAMVALGCRLLEGAQAGNSEIYFAIASTIFCWLLLRGRMIPAVLGWLGVVASALLVVILPLQLAGLFGGAMSWAASATWLVWMPMLLFEVTFSLWLLIKGVSMPTTAAAD